MSKISYLFERDLDNYVGLQRVSVLDTVSDVATLIEVFENTVKDINYKRIKYVVRDFENYFYLVVSDKDENFDFFSFVSECFDSDIKISSINARYLFPSRQSRGIYDSDVEDEEGATSYLDEEELGFYSENPVYELYQQSTGITLKIDNKGMIIGRSPKKVDYLIKDNGSIGRVHCNVYVNNSGKLMIHDYDSLNGTFVNNKRVHSSADVEVHEGDIITLANEEFRVI